MNSLLDARDQRQALLSRALDDAPRTLISLSLNVAGQDKLPRGSAALFSWALRETLAICPPFTPLEVSQDALGHYAVIASGRDPHEVKRLAVALENAHPAARLVDLDVFDELGRQIGRQALGLSARSCLLCAEAAVDCMRVKRHPIDQVIARTHELLSDFSA